ncbi:MAG: hypothetical protein ACFCUX_10190, partial [Candidatus Methylacidiphilales bacterium]
GERALFQGWVRETLRREPHGLSQILTMTEGDSSMKKYGLGSLLTGIYCYIFLDEDLAFVGRIVWKHEQNLRRIFRREITTVGASDQSEIFEEEFMKPPARSFPPRILSRLMVPAFSSAYLRMMFCEVRERQMLLAVALERHRLQHGQYPDSLAELIPIADRTWEDPYTLQPMCYRNHADGSYTLYSTGSDGMDNGGQLQTVHIPDSTKRLREHEASDWVWPR